MSDVKKTVEIALNIVGADTKSTKKVIAAFENITKTVDKTTTSINNFQKSLNSIKVPKSFGTIVESLKQLGGIKAPNLNNIAEGFQKLGAIKIPPNLDPFATQLKKLDGIKLPNLKQIADGLQLIMSKEGSLSGFNMKMTTLQSGLSRLQGITLPNLKQISTGLKALMSTPLSGFNMKLTTLQTGLKRLDGITLPNLAQIGAGLKKIMTTPLSGFNMKVTSLETGLKRLSAINLDALASVLQNISKINLGKAGFQLKKIEKGIRDIGTTAHSSGLKIRTFADKVRTVATFRVISGILVNLNQAFTSGITAIIEYDQALKDLQAITGATTLEVAQMGAKIIEVASTTKFSASEVAEGMRTIGQAGFSASEAVQTMQAVSDLATGTLSAMGSTVDLVTTAMRVFNIDASQSTAIVDTFANAVNKSKLTVDKLRTAMNYVGPIAKAAGINFKELSASMGTLANSGLRASTIGTGLRRVFAELVSPSKKLTEAAKNAGVALNELDPTSNGLAAVLNNLRLVLADAGTSFDIFGKRGAAAALALVSQDSGFTNMLEKVSQTGTAARMASIQMEGLGVSFKNLKDRLGVLSVAIGEGGLATAMRAFVVVAKNIVIVMTTITKSTFGGFVIAATLVTASIYTISTALTFLGTKVKIIKDIQVAFLLVRAGAVSAAQGVAILSKAFAPYVAVISILAGIAFAIDTIRGHVRESSEEAAKVADAYGTLSNVISNYKLSVVGLKDGSEKLKTTNLALRDSLLNTKNEFVELSTEAFAAQASINAINGTVTDSGEAIDAYAEKLDALQYDKLVQSSNLANESLKDQTGFLSRLGNQFSDLFATMGMSAEQYTAFQNKIIETNKYAELLSAGFDESGESFKNLGEVIKSWDHTKLTSQQREIIEGYEFINEQANKYIEYLQKTNKVGLDDTIENFRKLAKDAGISGVALTAVVEKLTILKKLSEEGFSNRIEKWEKDIKNADGSLKDYISSYLELNGIATEQEKIEAKSILTSQANFIMRLNQAKEEKVANLANGMSKTLAANIYYNKERRLIQESVELGKQAAESKLIQNSKMLAKLDTDLEIQLEKNALKYKNNADLIEKYRSAALIKYIIKRDKLLSGQTDDSLSVIDDYKKNLSEREIVLSVHLRNLKKQEAAYGITEEQAQKKKKDAQLAFYSGSVALAQKSLALINETQDPDEYKKMYRILTTAQKKYYTEDGNNALAAAEAKNEIKDAELDKAETISEAIYESAVKKQRAAQKTMSKELRASYDADILTIKEYYSKQRNLAFKDEADQKTILENRSKRIKAEFEKRISVENSAAEKTRLRGDVTAELLVIEAEINLLEQERIQTIDKLASAEDRATKASERRVEAILERLTKDRDRAQLSTPGIGVEESMRVELEAMKRGHELQIQELDRNKADQIQIAEALALQRQEILFTEATNDKVVQDLKLQQQVDFTGSMASMMESLTQTSLGQSEEFFKAYKAFAIAETIVSTYAAAQKAYEAAMEGAGPVWMRTALGVASAAAAIAAGLARVASIQAAKPPAYAEGGLIGGYSPTTKADNIDIRATAGEYVQPVSAVQKYGSRVMNAIRSLSIPKDALTGLLQGSAMGIAAPIPSFALATGGQVPMNSNTFEQKAPNVEINLRNNGAPLSVESKTSRKDKEKEVIDIVLSYSSQNKMNFKNNLKSMLLGRS